jgi:hypothetical protein
VQPAHVAVVEAVAGGGEHLLRDCGIARVAERALEHGAFQRCERVSVRTRVRLDRGHLRGAERGVFLAQARRVAEELVVVDSALREEVDPVEMQERMLGDGSRWQVYKRYFRPDELSAELGGGKTLFAGSWFVVVQAR